MSKIVVHTETEGQWDVVCNKYNILKCSSWNSDREESCIFFSKGEYSPRRFYVEEGYKVISFKEWVDKFGYKVGDWVLLSNDAWGWGSPMENINNKIFQITRIDIKDMEEEGGRYYFGKEMTVGKRIERKALPLEIPSLISVAKLEGKYVIDIESSNGSSFGDSPLIKIPSITVPLIKPKQKQMLDIRVENKKSIVIPII